MKVPDNLYSQFANFIDNRAFPSAMSVVLLILVFKLVRFPVAAGVLFIYDLFGYGFFGGQPGIDVVLPVILVPLCVIITYWLLVGAMYVYDKF